MVLNGCIGALEGGAYIHTSPAGETEQKNAINITLLAITSQPCLFLLPLPGYELIRALYYPSWDGGGGGSEEGDAVVAD